MSRSLSPESWQGGGDRETHERRRHVQGCFAADDCFFISTQPMQIGH